MATESTNRLGRIEGYVIDRRIHGSEQTANPVVNAQIRFRKSGYKTGTEPIGTALTDANGHYFIDLPEGKYDLVCDAFLPSPQTKSIPVTAGDVVRDVEFAIHVGLRLTCQVQSPDKQTRVPTDQVTVGTPVILHADYNTDAVQKQVTFHWQSDQGRLVNPDGGDQETLLQTEGALGRVNVSVTLSEVNSPQITSTASFNVLPAAGA
jgi:hypothetical protein